MGARRGENRRSARIWTAAVEEWDGSRRADFEVGYRDAETFLRLFRRLPEAAKYWSDHCEVYSRLPPARHVKGKGSEVNRNEGLRAKLRVRLNRLVRRTHGYGKRLAVHAGRVACDGVAQGQSTPIPARTRDISPAALRFLLHTKMPESRALSKSANPFQGKPTPVSP